MTDLTEAEDFRITRNAYGRYGFDLQRIGGKYSLSYHGKHLVGGSWREINEYLDSPDRDDDGFCDCPRCAPKPAKRRGRR